MHVSSMDNFGHRFNFFMNGQTSTKTLPGFIFTLLAASLSVASFYIFYNAMVDRTTPTIQVSKTVVQDSGEISVKDDFFIFILFINYGTLIPRSFMPAFGRLKVKLVYEELTDTPFPRVGNNSDSYFVESYDMVACNATKAYTANKGSLTPEMITALDFAGYCVPDLTDEQKQEWTIRTTSGKKYSQKKLAVEVYPCNLPVGCVPFIAKKDLFFYVSTVEKGFNGLDFEKPIIPILQAENRFLMLEGWHKSIDVSYARFTSKTDSGMLYSIIKEESGIRYEGISPYDYAPWGGTVNSPLITVNLVASLKHVSYFRSYGKLTVLVSNIGGIMQVTVSIIAVIYSIYNQYVRKRDLVVYGIMNMLPPEKDETKSVNSSSKNLNKSREEKGTEGDRSQLARSKTIALDPKSNMGSFWKYLCFSGRQRKKGNSTSLRNLEDFRYFEYWNDCERLLDYTTEVTSMLPLINEFEILRAVFFTNYHERLAPRVGIHFSHEDYKERLFYQNVSSQNVVDTLRARMLAAKMPENDGQEENLAAQQDGSGDSQEFPVEFPASPSQDRPTSSQSEADKPILKVLKEQLNMQVLKKYDEYREREKANFQIFSGIKEFLESAAFMNIQGLIQNDDKGSARRSQTQNWKMGSVKSKYGSGIQIPLEENEEVPQPAGQNRGAFSMKMIRQNSEMVGLNANPAMNGALQKYEKSQKLILGSKRTTVLAPQSGALPQEPQSLVLKSKTISMSGILGYNKISRKTPQIVSNQKIGVNSNPQLVRVKVGSKGQQDSAEASPSLNGAKPITVGASSTQHILQNSQISKN